MGGFIQTAFDARQIVRGQLDSARLADGSVTDAALERIAGLTSDAQTQINARATTTYVDAGDATLSASISTLASNTSTALAAKASTSYVDSQDAALSAAISGKASTGYVDSSIAAAVSGLASTDYVDDAIAGIDLSPYATTAYVDAADSALQTAIDGKANASHTHDASAIVSGTLDAARLPSGIDPAKLADGSISTTEFQYLNGVTSGIQSQLDGKAATSHTHDASAVVSGVFDVARIPSLPGSIITSGTIDVARLPTAIPATSIGGGSVSNTEFGYLDGVTSALQTQLDGKAASSHTHSASDITAGTLSTARLPTGIDAANIGTGVVSNTEFGYLDGVTSAIQTQIDGKAPTSHVHSAADITSGTLSTARLPTGIDAANIGGGAVSNTEFSYLDGVTSAVQTQLDAKSPVIRNVCGGRLTLASGQPVADASSASTIYFTPAYGLPNGSDQISLYYNGDWHLFSFSEISVAVPSTKYRRFDIFAYWDAATSSVKLETLDWNQTTGAITSITNATPAVVTASANGRSAGDVVFLDGMATATAFNGVAYVLSAVATNTMTLGDSVSGAGAGTGGAWYSLNNTRATTIASQNGVPVKSGDPTRRLIGTGSTFATSGQTDDYPGTDGVPAKRLLNNLYNRVPRRVFVIDSTNTWTYSTNNVWREVRGQNNKPNRVYYVVCDNGDIDLTVTGSMEGGTLRASFGIGDDTTAAVADLAISTSSYITSTARKIWSPLPGLHFASWVEATWNGSYTAYGDDGRATGTNVAAGITGRIMG